MRTSKRPMRSFGEQQLEEVEEILLSLAREFSNLNIHHPIDANSGKMLTLDRIGQKAFKLLYGE